MKISIFSKAAHSTWIHFPEFNLLFDCGEGCATQLGINKVASIKNIVIGHTHKDHFLGLPNLIALRARHGDNIPKLTIWLPETNTAKTLIGFITTIQNHKLNNVEFIYYGENNAIIELSKTRIVTIFKTNHCYNSWGLNLIEKRTRLKESLKGLSDTEIRNLIACKVEVKESYSKTLVTYTGDTPPIEDTSIFQNPDLLICDATYLDKDDNNENYKHCTLEDSIKMFKSSGAKQMIGMHVSARYDALCLLKVNIPPNVKLNDPDRINNYLI